MCVLNFNVRFFCAEESIPHVVVVRQISILLCEFICFSFFLLLLLILACVYAFLIWTLGCFFFFEGPYDPAE